MGRATEMEHNTDDNDDDDNLPPLLLNLLDPAHQIGPMMASLVATVEAATA
jgi:hypothetical protein